jgi:hypothetical protein
MRDTIAFYPNCFYLFAKIGLWWKKTCISFRVVVYEKKFSFFSLYRNRFIIETVPTGSWKNYFGKTDFLIPSSSPCFSSTSFTT